jgi:hypothetical protein
MYPIALAVFLGFAVAYATDLILSNVTVLQRVPLLGKADYLFPALTVLVVWAADVSILGAYGLGGDRWLDVVGSAFAVVVATKTVDEVTNALTR